jgi:hypothetical protein
MTVSKLLSAVAVALVAATGAAHAETYEGVHRLTSAESRADVASQAVAAAHSADPYAEGANANVAQAPVSQRSRDEVRAEAVVAAHSPDAFSEAASAGMTYVAAGAVDPSVVRAAARAAARGDALPL